MSDFRVVGRITPKPPGNPDVIDNLRALLARAEAGEIIGFSAALDLSGDGIELMSCTVNQRWEQCMAHGYMLADYACRNVRGE